MKLKELRALIASEPPENDDLEVKVWLPGSTITLGTRFISSVVGQGDALMIEGNVDEGVGPGDACTVESGWEK